MSAQDDGGTLLLGAHGAPVGALRPRVALVPAVVCLSRGWDVDLECWGPAREAGRGGGGAIEPTATARITDVSLGDWWEFSAAVAQLSPSGVAVMEGVTGVGVYSKRFELRRNDLDAGAVIDLGQLADVVMDVTINGVVADATYPFTRAVDLARGLRVGVNHIEVVIDWSLRSAEALNVVGSLLGGCCGES